MIANERLLQNLERIRTRMEQSAQRAGVRVPKLLAVTKSCDDETFRRLLALGVCDVGENRARACEARAAILNEEFPHASMHFIGTLQQNKVKYIIGKMALLHSLDSLTLAEEVERLAAKKGITVDVLAEVNSGRELCKGGVMPEDIDGFIDRLSLYPHIRLCGMMTMAPRLSSQEEYRPYFRETRRIFDRLTPRFATSDPILSMGMSGSFETAIEEGATLVRVGSAIFA